MVVCTSSYIDYTIEKTVFVELKKNVGHAREEKDGRDAAPHKGGSGVTVDVELTRKLYRAQREL